MEAHKIGTSAALKRRQGYAPTVGVEHCPACWVSTGAASPLRTETHHNGARVSVAVCDCCGLFAVL